MALLQTTRFNARRRRRGFSGRSPQITDGAATYRLLLPLLLSRESWRVRRLFDRGKGDLVRLN
jgi:hypothetical protein